MHNTKISHIQITSLHPNIPLKFSNLSPHHNNTKPILPHITKNINNKRPIHSITPITTNSKTITKHDTTIKTPQGFNTGAKKFTSYLQKEIITTTQKEWEQGKLSLPSGTSLRAAQDTFGKPSLDHSFTREPDILNISIFILKSNWLDWKSFIHFLSSNPYIHKLWESLVHLSQLSFLSLQTPDSDYASKTCIPADRVSKFLACDLHYDLDLSLVIRFVQGNFTASYRNVKHIVHNLKQADNISQYIIDQVERIMTAGCPSYFNNSSSRTNFIDYLQYGNHASIKKHAKKL